MPKNVKKNAEDFETVDGVTRIYAMPFTTTSTMWQLSFPYAEEAARVLVKDPAALKAEIVRRCAAWHAVRYV